MEYYVYVNKAGHFLHRNENSSTRHIQDALWDLHGNRNLDGYVSKLFKITFYV